MSKDYGTSPLIDAVEAAEIAGICRRQVYRLAERGEIPAVRIGSSWRINREKFMRQLGLSDEPEAVSADAR